MTQAYYLPTGEPVTVEPWDLRPERDEVIPGLNALAQCHEINSRQPDRLLQGAIVDIRKPGGGLTRVLARYVQVLPEPPSPETIAETQAEIAAIQKAYSPHYKEQP